MKKPLLLLCLLFIPVFSVLVNAQIPTIASFSPVSGPVGTLVTITGTNFSTTPADNFVWFGATRATVSSATATQLIVTVPTGATYQPITVTVNGYTAYSKSPFIMTFISDQTIDANSFDPKVDFNTLYLPGTSALGDIDMDGKPDVVIINYNSRILSVYRNTSTSGTITTGSFAAKVDFATNYGPSNVRIGDMDGDGKPDIVVINLGSHVASVFRNTSTPGTIDETSLAPRVDFSTGTNPQDVVIGDIDLDGKTDIMSVNGSTMAISILRNTSIPGSLSAGSFAGKVDFPGIGLSPRSIAIGDIDGDGKPDLAITDETSTMITLYRNTSSPGSITASSLATGVDFPTGTTHYGINFGDIDGDGKPDMVTSNSTDRMISVYRNISTPGTVSTGSFASKVDFPTTWDPFGVTIGDMNGDGKPDLIVNNYVISVYKNLSTSGSITSSSLAPRVDYSAGSYPPCVSIGDVDGDGKPDLIAPDNMGTTFSVLRNTIPGPPVISSFSPTSGPVGTTVSLIGRNFNTTAANNIVWFGATRATVTYATETLLTVTVPPGATFKPITVTSKGLTGYSNSPFILTFSDSQTIDANSFAGKVDYNTGMNASFSEITDIDGDGRADIATSGYNNYILTVFKNTSTPGSITSGSLANKIDLPTYGQNSMEVAFGDIDGDGKQDLILASHFGTLSIYRNVSTNGSITTGSFAGRVDFATGSFPFGIVIKDFDGDGKSDIAVSNEADNTISIFKNSSIPGSISAGSLAPKVDFQTGTNPYSLISCDIDGDGKPDLVVVNRGNNSISVLRNLCEPGSIISGSFAPKTDFTTGSYPYYLASGDLDGDNKPDIVVSNAGTENSISILKNTSSPGTISSSSFALKVDFPTPYSHGAVDIGDINGDGKLDIAVVNGGGISVYKNISTPGTISSSSFAPYVDFGTDSSPNGVRIGDIDGDGKPDILTTNGVSISILRNTISELPDIPAAPLIGTITQPTCVLATGSVALSGLPSSGTWTLTRSPGGVTTTGSGTTTTVSGIPPGTYTFTVTNASGSTSAASSSAIINIQPSTPTAPVVGTITHPTCVSSTGSVALGGLPASGSWTITRMPGNNTTNGSGTGTTITGLASGSYTFTVSSAAGCTSASSSGAAINAQPPTPSAPVAGLITRPTCSVPTGSVVINGLPASGSWTLTRTPGGSVNGTGTSTTVSGLAPDTYSFTVTNSSGCTSLSLGNVIIEEADPGVIPKIKQKFDGEVLIVINLGDSLKSYQWYKDGAKLSTETLQYIVTKNKPGTYYAEATDLNGCKNSSANIPVTKSATLTAYPNPVYTTFGLEFDFEMEEEFVISIINSSGTKVMEIKAASMNDQQVKEIPVNTIDKGIHIVKVTLKNGEQYFTKIAVIK